MEILISVTELLIFAGIGWAILENLADSEELAPQEEPIPVPIENRKPPSAH